MKTTRRILALVQAVLLLAGLAIPALAAGEITPYYNNTISDKSSVTIFDSGLLTIYNQHRGIQGTTAKVVVTTYIEKKVLGLFWSRVDIGQPDNQWVDTAYGDYYNSTHTHQLDSTGTYRVTAIFVVSGTGGADDEITQINEVVYS